MRFKGHQPAIVDIPPMTDKEAQTFLDFLIETGHYQHADQIRAALNRPPPENSSSCYISELRKIINKNHRA